jgi:hypothetical protein
MSALPANPDCGLGLTDVGASLYSPKRVIGIFIISPVEKLKNE